MRKFTKVGMASLLTIALAGGTTAAFASMDAQTHKTVDVTRDVNRRELGKDRRHVALKDHPADRSRKDVYKESWNGAKDGRDSKDAPSPDLFKG